MKAVNIKWDVSEDDMDSDDIMECLSELPNEIEIPKDMTDMDDEFHAQTSDRRSRSGSGNR